MTFFNGIPEDSREVLRRADEIGTWTAYNHYPVGWAHAMDTPFQWAKQIASHFGGTRNGLVISWPARIRDVGALRSQSHHVIDIAPTVLEVAGLRMPDPVNGVTQKPVEGVSIPPPPPRLIRWSPPFCLTPSPELYTPPYLPSPSLPPLPTPPPLPPLSPLPSSPPSFPSPLLPLPPPLPPLPSPLPPPLPPPPLASVSAHANTYDANSPIRGKTAETVAAPNGALVNAEILANRKLIWHQTRETYQVAPNVYVLPGEILNAAFIVGDDGVIAWESGEGNEDGAHYLAEIRKVTDKPVRALIYSHAHYTLGSVALLDGATDAMIIGHPNLNRNMQAGGLGSYFPETEPVQWARAVQHLQMLLPPDGPDGQFGFVVNLGERGFLPVTKPVENGEELTVAGIRMQFFTEGGSDTDDCVTVWAPDLGVCLSNILWPMMPNFYTPRGAKFRDPRVWRTALDVIRKLEPQVLINQHAKALDDPAEIQEALGDYHAFCGLVLDQTLRGILKGQGPEQLREFIQLPPQLAASPWLFESYGLLQWYAPYIMNYAIGWWDGDASTLAQVTPTERAARLVPLLGGRAKVLEAAATSSGRWNS